MHEYVLDIMSTPASSPSRKMSTLRRWNSILGSSEHKRSQSMNAVHPSHAPSAMRSTASLSMLRSGDDEQSIASSNQESIAEEVDQVSPIDSVYSGSSLGTSPPPRPKPAPRLWQETSSAGDSLRGLETAIAPNHSLPSKNTSPTRIVTSFLMTSSPPSPSLSESPKSVVSKFSSWKEKSFAGRRKGSLPDLQLTSQKHTRTFSPDSPTLPPIQSARTPSTVITHGSITPRPISGSPTWSQAALHPALKTPEWKERDVKRASSMLLPKDATPIVVPSTQARIPPVPHIDTSMVNRLDEERPPRPPPKSPRTLLRAFPIPRSSSSTSGHTANSSITSISPDETPLTAATTWSPVSIQSASIINIPDTFSRSPSRYNAGATSSDDASRNPSLSQAKNLASSPTQHGRSTSNNEPRHLPQKSSSAALRAHSRMTSEGSVIHRGRPMKRGEVIIPRGPVRGVTMGLINDSFAALPQGIRKSQSGRIPIDELSGLRRDAEELASNYNILTQQQIAGLNQEQRVLDETCDQIQHTISGLKEARSARYASLKMSLEQSASILPLYDSVVKQTGTLGTLDSEIDEWQAKLDTATERKLAIQMKMWEHLAAILAAVNMAAEVGAGRPEEYTPPRSPERVVRRSLIEDPIQEDAILNDGDERPRHDVESITIYADSGVASLLRSIEEELDVIDQSRHEVML